MPDDEKARRNKHEGGIENVYVRLAQLQRARRPAGKLSNTEYGSDHDEYAGGVQNVEETLPWKINSERSWGGCAHDTPVEDAGNDHKKTEENDLEYETACDDVLAQVYRRLRFSVSEHAAS